MLLKSFRDEAAGILLKKLFQGRFHLWWWKSYVDKTQCTASQQNGTLRITAQVEKGKAITRNMLQI